MFLCISYSIRVCYLFSGAQNKLRGNQQRECNMRNTALYDGTQAPEIAEQGGDKATFSEPQGEALMHEARANARLGPEKPTPFGSTICTVAIRGYVSL